METRENLQKITREQWEKLVSKRCQEDLQIQPMPGKEFTPDVSPLGSRHRREGREDVEDLPGPRDVLRLAGLLRNNSRTGSSS